jgi:hypothetical protein
LHTRLVGEVEVVQRPKARAVEDHTNPPALRGARVWISLWGSHGQERVQQSLSRGFVPAPGRDEYFSLLSQRLRFYFS